MIDCNDFYRIMVDNGFNYYTGVPDSTFKSWMSFLADNHPDNVTNRIAAIERDAVGFAGAYYAATGNIGVVYLQNSGLGNIINPLTSLTDSTVYSIPCMLMIGWRGEPGTDDEPQHRKMGEMTIPLLECAGIDYTFLDHDDRGKNRTIIGKARKYMTETRKCFALIIRKKTFAPYNPRNAGSLYMQNQSGSNGNEGKVSGLLREQSIHYILKQLGEDDLVISTTGKTSRELFEYREASGQGHRNDFLMVGSMGLAASFGCEIAMQKKNRRVFVLDGDGSLIMSMGALSIIGYYKPDNFYHIVFDNQCHESTGGQPTTSATGDFCGIAEASGYSGSCRVETAEGLTAEIRRITDHSGPFLICVATTPGSRKDLGRPTVAPQDNLRNFMKTIQGGSGI